MADTLNRIFETIYLWLYDHLVHILLTAVIIGLYYLIRGVIIPRLERYVERDQLKQQTYQSALFTVSLLAGLVALAIVLVVWGINVRELLSVSTGILAVTGVALFATWSILSNITAFFILLANPIYKRGNYIRVFDVDNYAEGYISQINIFSTVLITEQREMVVYPNNLLTARATIINPKERVRPVGKIDDFRTPSSQTDDGLPQRD